MRDYYRWTALLGAAVLTLSSPIQVLAEETVQGGASIETAVMVPSLPVNGEGQAADFVGNTGSIAEYEAADSGSGAVSPGNETQQIAPGLPKAEDGMAGTTDVPADGGTAGNAQTAENSGQPAVETVPKDYSLGPGYSYEEPVEEEPVEEIVVEEPEPEPEPLPVPNPVQTLPSQPIRGIISQDGSVSLADVTNSIVQVSGLYSYDQMILDMSLLKVRYEDKIHIREMGESLDNRKIYDCIIGNVNAPKHVLIQAGIHAREYMNPLMLMQQMELILANYDTGSFHRKPLSEMFNSVAVHFVPMTNPDGITISQYGPEFIRSASLREQVKQCYASDIARGKANLNAASYYSRWKANARGVDLNLNFDALWLEIGGGVPSSDGYRGAAPASEPETQAMINLYNNPDYPWAAVLHYHSMGNVIYWDIRGNKVQAESLELAQLMSSVTGGYRILPSSGGGGFKDWIQLSDHPVASVTLETGSVSCPIPVTYYGGIWNQNCLTWAYAMEWAAVH